MASLSNSGLAHPPRSNPPLRFSSRPPFPCTTPSTETCVVVVSFMIAVSFSLGAPLVGDRSPLLRTPLPRSDTAPRIYFKTFWYAGCERSDSLKHCRAPAPAVDGRLHTAACARTAAVEDRKSVV